MKIILLDGDILIKAFYVIRTVLSPDSPPGNNRLDKICISELNTLLNIYLGYEPFDCDLEEESEFLSTYQGCFDIIDEFLTTKQWLVTGRLNVIKIEVKDTTGLTVVHVKNIG